jgi:predicted DNA-binding transcriptional regulator AlpA
MTTSAPSPLVTLTPAIFLTLEEVCAILRVPKSTFYSKRSRDQWGPPATRIAGSLLFRASEFSEWLDAQPSEGPNREVAV